MATPDDHARWAIDEQVLAEIGQALHAQPLEVTVRIPGDLARRALAAWQRDEEATGAVGPESAEERTTRGRAGTLALIGIAVEQLDEEARSQAQVELPLHAWFVGDACAAADDADLL